MDLLDPLVQKVNHDFSATFNSEVMGLISSSFGDMVDVIHKHTLFDYYAIFREHGFVTASLSTLRSGGHSIGLRTPQYNKEYRVLRYCPRCAQEDRFMHGEAYYHVQHQIPDINVCLRHRCKLKRSHVRMHERYPIALIAADAIIPQDIVAVDADKFELLYAGYLDQLIGKSYPFVGSNLHLAFRSLVPDNFIDDGTHVIDTLSFAQSITNMFCLLGTGVIPAHEIELVLMGRCANSRLVALLGYYLGIDFESLGNRVDMTIKGILPSEWKVI